MSLETLCHALGVQGFNAELYLRLAGERMLTRRAELNRGHWGLPVMDAARALVAVGAISVDAAQEVADEYQFATALRDEHAMHLRAGRRSVPAASPTGPRALEPRRVVAIGQTIEQPLRTMHVRYASLSHGLTTIGVDLADRTTASSRRKRRGVHMRIRGTVGPTGGPPQATLSDDRGTTTAAHFAGSGTEGEWHGSFRALQPIAPDTRWIEIDGTRFDLLDERPGVDVQIELLSHDSPAIAYLWHQLAAPDVMHRGSDGLASAIEALLAAGALRREDPALQDLRDVQASLEHGGQAASRRSRFAEPWGSLIARRTMSNGAVGSVLIGAVTPVFDGFSVGVGTLDASESGFELDVEVAPSGNAMPFNANVDSQRLVWWAADDRGNSYLGNMGGWSGGGDRDSGEISFAPGIDPRATRIDLLPTAQAARAVIRVPLPWATGAE